MTILVASIVAVAHKRLGTPFQHCSVGSQRAAPQGLFLHQDEENWNQFRNIIMLQRKVELEQQARRVIFASTQKKRDLEARGISVDMANIQKLANGEGNRQDVANLKAGEHRSAAQVQRQEEFWPSNFVRLLRFFYVRRCLRFYTNDGQIKLGNTLH
jgi:hypothetical protein